MILNLHTLVQDYLPPKRKQNAKGWHVFDAVCCQHRGHKPDTRARGNVLLSANGSIVANCYNCGFKAVYTGGEMSHAFETWLEYLGAPRSRIQEVKLEILSKQLSGEIENATLPVVPPSYFPEVALPANAMPISFIQSVVQSPELITCLQYLHSRGRAIANGWNYHWTPTTKWNLNKRIIIPFYYQGRIVGWTGRYAGRPPAGISRYHNSDLPAGYLFNADVLFNYKRRFALISEGPLDAIAVDGVGALGSTLNQQQISLLNSSPQIKVVVPDRQAKNQNLIDIALDQGWHVSFPDWENHIKDSADASMRYGKLYTISSILSARTDRRLQISMKRQTFKG